MKEVLQGLVDDGLVQGDKIGSSNCRSHPFLTASSCCDLLFSFLELSVRAWRNGAVQNLLSSDVLVPTNVII